MDEFKGKNILVFGLGLNQGGVGTALFFAKNGANVRVTDLKSKEILQSSLDQLKEFPEITYILGEHKNEDIDWANLIIKNPGVKPGNQYIEYAKSKSKQVELDMGIFLDYVNPSQIIGITGTKGKSTTSSLIYEILRSAGENVILAGNIGKSVFDVIPHINKETLVILELSSFQLEAFDLHKLSPKYAVITNIYPDHLNYYKSMEEYIAAKKIIGKYQTNSDYLFINEQDKTLNNPQFLKGLQGKIIYYSAQDLPADFQPSLKGEHNKSNIAASLAVAKAFDITEDQALNAVQNFKGVDFRQQLIKEWGGVKIINDTTATGPDAAIQALKTYPNSILICGGMNKGMDYTEFAKVVDENVKKVFFLEGDSTDAIISSLRAQRSNLKIHEPYNNLEKLLNDVKDFAKSGDTILFSPAATSFNLFQNEFDRGRKFNESVQKIFA
ncbi:MAG: UDP-N-acetylmuramoyl-L-alanine--D-glutamate ligase [Candidatus Daviesbacteria bacterium]|nr:UDP-N-acetylmuramoyl-L-alanine--D-glutamate ligase [Candidatus Daviesbacteria bacterium]